MNDITIKSKRLIREIKILIVIFVLMFLLNIISIFGYDTSWIELITEIPIVLMITVIIYSLYSLIRILYNFVKNMASRF